MKWPARWALLLTLAWVVVLFASAPAIGFVRDEGYYFKAAEEYSGWWSVVFSSRFLEAFSDAEIHRHFGYNTEHPALVKLLQGATWIVFHRWLGVVDGSQGFRCAGFLFAGLSAFATFMLGRRFVSPWAGLLAAAFLVTEPRYFFDAHLATFDVPMAAMWALSLYTFFEALTAPHDRARRTAWIASLVFGLSLATKVNALFLPLVFVPLWLFGAREFDVPPRVRVVAAPSGGTDVLLPRVPRVLVLSLLIGPVVFIVLWPHLWHDTLRRMGAYVGFHLHHEHYPISYFHELFVKPPFPPSFPFVMSWNTLPSPVLLLGILGFMVSVLRVFRRRSTVDLMLVLGTLVPFLLIVVPGTPIFGGVKHWYNAMPTLAVLAARSACEGIECASAVARSLFARRGLTVLLGGLAVLPGALGCWMSHPNGIGFYSELAGGFRGGAELGLQRGFWGTLARPLLPSLMALPPGSGVFFNRMNYDSFRTAQREGLVTKDVYYSNDAKGAQAAIHFEQPEHGEREGEIWSNLGTRPVSGNYQDNVTLTQLYWRGRSDRAP